MRPVPRWLLVAALAACRGTSPGDDDAVVPDASTVDATPQIGCAADTPRTPATTTFIGPTGLETRFEQFIDAAQSTLDVQMYLFTIDALAQKVIDAHQRGVAVRVLLDPDEAGNVDTKAVLEAAGVPVKDDPTIYPYAHAKYLVADGARALVMSANFNYGATSSERNYGATDDDPEDIADLEAIFESDWDPPSGVAELGCTRLIVSPVNARVRLLALINSADTALDISTIYISDSTVRTAVIQAHDRGTAVRVILADDASYPDNTATAQTLATAGVPVKILRNATDLHAKLIVGDGVAFIGSENMSPTSINQNREVGLLATEPAAVAPIQTQFDADWAAASAP
jgi:cardiolipin synthase